MNLIEGKVNRMKRIALWILCALMLLSLCACGETDQPEQSHLPQEGTVADEPLNTTVELFDEAGKKLGEIAQNGAATLFEAGILYTSAAENNGTQYRLYAPERGEDLLLGTLADQSYEASYTRLSIGGKIYTLAVTGNLYDSEPDPLWLLELDPQSGLTQYKLSDNGFPYAGMTAVGGRILVWFHDQGETELTDRVLEFDPKSGELREVMTYTLQNELSGDTLRGACEMNGRLCLLRVHFESADAVTAWLDLFDVTEFTDDDAAKAEYKAAETVEITDLLRAAAERAAAADDLTNELMQSVAHFRVIDGRYLWYENFSITRCLADLETAAVFGETDAYLSLAPGGEIPVFWYLLGGADGTDRNLYTLRGGALEKTELSFIGADEGLLSASCAPGGEMLLGVAKLEKASEYRLVLASFADTAAAGDL